MCYKVIENKKTVNYSTKMPFKNIERTLQFSSYLFEGWHRMCISDQNNCMSVHVILMYQNIFHYIISILIPSKYWTGLKMIWLLLYLFQLQYLIYYCLNNWDLNYLHISPFLSWEYKATRVFCIQSPCVYLI